MAITKRRIVGMAVTTAAMAGMIGMGFVGPASATQSQKPHIPATEMSPAQAAAERCVVPSKPDQKVLRILKKIGDKRKINGTVRLSMFEAAWVESHANNLNCGDSDSVGVFQQRPSQGWCDPAKLCRDVEHATNKYLDQAIPNNKKNPKWSAGKLAQSVQRSAYPDRYDAAEKKAKELIKQSAK